MKRSIVFSYSEGSLEITVPEDGRETPDAPEFGKVPAPALVKVGSEVVEFKSPEDFDDWIDTLTEAKKNFEERRKAA